MATQAANSPNGVNGQQYQSRYPADNIKPMNAFTCGTLDSLTVAVRELLERNSTSFIPELLQSSFIFGPDVLFPVSGPGSAGVADPKDGDTAAAEPQQQQLDQQLDQGSVPVSAGFEGCIDKQETARLQRPFVKCLMKAVKAGDGFNYFGGGHWMTGTGLNWKYICTDSLQNPDRAANKAQKKIEKNTPSAAAPNSNRPAHAKTYDCKGRITIKFWNSIRSIELIYQHLPIHRQQRLPGLMSVSTDAQAQPINNGFQTNGKTTPAVQVTPLADKQSLTQEPPKKKRKRRTKAEMEAASVGGSAPSATSSAGLDTLVQAVQADVNGSQNASFRDVNGDMHGLELVVEMLQQEKSGEGATSGKVDPRLGRTPKSKQKRSRK